MRGLVLGWKVTQMLEPKYWLGDAPKAGRQPDSELVSVPGEDFATHSVIVAQSGSGKSYFLGRLIEELLVRTKAKCLVPCNPYSFG